MKSRTLKVTILLSVLFAILATATGYTQEEVTTVNDSAFKERMRPSARFEHEQHNEKAEIEECSVCHHVYEEGKKVEDESSEDRECSECHAKENPANAMPLVRVYHLRCKGCHIEKKAGPIMCGECHIKAN